MNLMMCGLSLSELMLNISLSVPEALPDDELALLGELEDVEDELLELDAVVGRGLLGGAGLGVEEGDLLARDVLRQLPDLF